MAHEYPRQLFQDQPEPKARQLNEAAETLSYCRRREALLRKARQMNKPRRSSTDGYPSRG
jgi:hypothetical protein